MTVCGRATHRIRLFEAIRQAEQRGFPAWRQRPEGVIAQLVEATDERLLTARPEVAPQPDRLVEVGAAHVEPVGCAEIAELLLVPAGPEPEVEAPSEDIELLQEIRDLLRQRSGQI